MKPSARDVFYAMAKMAGKTTFISPGVPGIPGGWKYFQLDGESGYVFRDVKEIICFDPRAEQLFRARRDPSLPFGFYREPLELPDVETKRGNVCRCQLEPALRRP